MNNRARHIVALLLYLGLILCVSWGSVQGQAGELLQNPGFTSYYGIGGANVVPIGWKLTSSIPIGTSSHSYIYDGPVEYPGQPSNGQAWALSAHSARFTAIGYQHVPGVAAGTKVRFSAYGNVYTCNKSDSCIENGIPYRISDKSSGAVERVGIDPEGGSDPYAPAVQWSTFFAPFDRFTYMNVTVVVSGTNGVTVFLYATQSTAMLLNDAYWYGASLQAIGSGPEPRGPTATNAAPGVIPSAGAVTTPGVAPTAAPVKTQTAQPDGSVVHTVIAGDTLFALALAYRVPIAQIELLNNVSSGSLLQIGQKLLIRPANTPIPSATSLVPTRANTRPIISLRPGLDGSTVTAYLNETAMAMASTPTVETLSGASSTDSRIRLLIALDVVGFLTLLLYLGGIVWGIIIVRLRQG